MWREDRDGGRIQRASPPPEISWREKKEYTRDRIHKGQNKKKGKRRKERT